MNLSALHVAVRDSVIGKGRIEPALSRQLSETDHRAICGFEKRLHRAEGRVQGIPLPTAPTLWM
ncbi:MAG: hypothetical protein ACM3US_11535 [Sphingomonadaceae bacterium]